MRNELTFLQDFLEILKRILQIFHEITKKCFLAVLHTCIVMYLTYLNVELNVLIEDTLNCNEV